MWYVAERYVQCLEKNEAMKLLEPSSFELKKEEKGEKLENKGKLHFKEKGKPTTTTEIPQNDTKGHSTKATDDAGKVANEAPVSPKKESASSSSEEEGRPRRSGRVAKPEYCSTRAEDFTEERKRRRSSRVTRAESLARDSRESTRAKTKGNVEGEETGKFGRTTTAGKRKALLEETENTEKGTKRRKAMKNIKKEENEITMEQEILEKTPQINEAEINGASDELNEGSGKLQVEHALGEEEGKESKTNQKDWVPVYLTPREIRGLRELSERLKTWPTAQKSVPSSIEQPGRLLKRLEVCTTQFRCV